MSVKTKQKLLSLVMAFALGLTLFVAPAPAHAAIDMITLADSNNFTILGDIDDEFYGIQVVGLDGTTWMTEDITDPENIEWTSSDIDVVGLIDGMSTTDTLSGVDTVDIKLLGSGQAYVTATYDGKTVSAVVVVESGSVSSNVASIEVQLIGTTPATTFTESSLTVPLNALSWLVDQSKTLQNDPSALTALSYALDQQHYSGWAASNLVVFSGGSYVSQIGLDANSWTDGWQYKVIRGVNTIVPDFAASVFKLEAGDKVIWEYKAF